LARAYSLKATADYGLGAAVTSAEAEQAIEMAARFVDSIARSLSS